jgi:16S rRNA (adenine1518-N6/adenine1519-N6)-dimethyltransferase
MESLLGPADVRVLAARLGVRPTKKWGQNFVVDPNTIRRIVAASDITADDVVLEVGPGLGSLTLGLLEVAKSVTAVEIDPTLAKELPITVAKRLPARVDALTVLQADALHLESLPGELPTALVANLPYNVSVPVLLTLLAQFPSIKRALVLVQAEVADRLAAEPGDSAYGIPSAKLRWFGTPRRSGNVPRPVFWPVPNVDSGLVAFVRHDVQPPEWADADRSDVFAVIDAAFSQRRKTLRSALERWAGSKAAVDDIAARAGIDAGLRGEVLGVDAFVKLAAAKG